MRKAVEKKKRKKKGRPSLIDLQKRSLKQQKQAKIQNSKSTLKSAQNSQPTPPSLRRSTRRKPNLPAKEREEDDDDDDELAGKRREKKLKLVLESNSDAGDSNAGMPTVKKRKIEKINGRSEPHEAEKVEMSNSGANSQQGSQVDLGSSTPLPDKSILLMILQRLQKLDKYGVFSEPVDPEELPDYHDIIEHPMDFGTIRKKLDNGAYANLEQIERDVFLISSNAMQYNSPDTIYFRQARSIQDLAKKSFDNLRHVSDDNEPETKLARRGRPPTKNVKKTSTGPPMEQVGSEVNSNTMLPSGIEIRAFSNNEMRKGPFCDKTRNNEAFGSGPIENRYDRNEYTGLLWKAHLAKYGKTQYLCDEDRRYTYVQFHPCTGRRDSSVLTTFGQRKQLVAVGHFTEHGYARSLARFAANLGPVAWKYASKRIDRSLPAGIKFGCGWIGENDVPQGMPSVQNGQLKPGRLSWPKHFSSVESSSSLGFPGAVEKKEEASESGNKSSEVHMGSQRDDLLEKQVRSTETIDNSVSDSVSVNKPNSAFQINQSPITHPQVNGLNGFNLPPLMTKVIGPSRPVEFNLQSSEILESISRGNKNCAHPHIVNSSNKEDTRSAEDSGSKPGNLMPNSESEELPAPVSGSQPSLQGLSQEEKSDAELQQTLNPVPPDLNLGFRSPESPNSCKVDSMQPDLALQL